MTDIRLMKSSKNKCSNIVNIFHVCMWQCRCISLNLNEFELLYLMQYKDGLYVYVCEFLYGKSMSFMRTISYTKNHFDHLAFPRPV